MPLAGTSTVPSAVFASYGTVGTSPPTGMSIAAGFTGFHTLPVLSVISFGVYDTLSPICFPATLTVGLSYSFVMPLAGTSTVPLIISTYTVKVLLSFPWLSIALRTTVYRPAGVAFPGVSVNPDIIWRLPVPYGLSSRTVWLSSVSLIVTSSANFSFVILVPDGKTLRVVSLLPSVPLYSRVGDVLLMLAIIQFPAVTGSCPTSDW